MRAAVVDVGSNSVRLFLCEGVDADGPSGERTSTVIGLKRGAGDDGTLAADALERLDGVLAAYADRIRAFAPAETVAVCTSAVRDAPNRVRVVDALERAVDAEVHILEGEQEAALAFAGAALAPTGDRRVMVIDVGGGSTELVAGTSGRLTAAVSLQLGAVRQTEMHVRDDPPTAAQMLAVRDDALAAAASGIREIGGPAAAVAVAGTATTLAAIDLGGYDPRRVHGHRMSRRRMEEIVELLAGVPLEERRRIPGLEPARAGVIPAGAAILTSVLTAAGLDDVVVSERDILDGVALAIAARPDGSRELVTIVA